MSFFFYFAFGSNLLKARIQYMNKGAIFHSIGCLQNYSLEFVSHGKRWHGSLATILATNGTSEDKISPVWGCVWKVPEEFSATLDEQEKGYHRLEVPIEVNGEIITCRTYQFSDLNATKADPSPHYKKVIVEGAKEHHLPAEYQEKLNQIKSNGYVGKVDVDIPILKSLNGYKESL